MHCEGGGAVGPAGVPGTHRPVSRVKTVPVPSGPSPRPLWLADLQAASSSEVAWLWQGYIARGGVTLLTSQWKAGKTTLLSVLLARLKIGGALAGLDIRPGTC